MYIQTVSQVLLLWLVGVSTWLVSCIGAQDVKFNQIQVIHSHNSYHLAPSEDLLGLLTSQLVIRALPDVGLLSSVESLEYSHASITEQLSTFGVRSFELDVFYDPDGGLFANRAGAKLAGLNGTSSDPAWLEPGYKVLHIPDLDFETSCVTLKSCLLEIKQWSEENPDHVPVTIYVEPQSFDTKKEIGSDLVGLIESLLQANKGEPNTLANTLEITRDAFEDLEQEILEVFGPDLLITPNDLRKDKASLKESVIDADGWPTLSEMRGRVLVVISPPFTGRLLNKYPNMDGSPFFSSAFGSVEDSHTLFVLSDALNPTLMGNMSTWPNQIEEWAQDAKDLVEKGYMVRAFTDSFTVEARANFSDRQEAIFASGAHFLSTDFPGGRLPSLFVSDYTVELEDRRVAVCNPITAPPSCKRTLSVEKAQLDVDLDMDLNLEEEINADGPTDGEQDADLSVADLTSDENSSILLGTSLELTWGVVFLLSLVYLA